MTIFKKMIKIVTINVFLIHKRKKRNKKLAFNSAVAERANLLKRKENMEEKTMKKKFSRKWKIGAVATMMASLSLGGVVTACNKEEPPAEGLGVFYFDAGVDEYQLSLEDGNKVTFIVGGESKTGTYTNDGSSVTFKFDGEETETNATLEDNVLTLTYNNEQMRFFKKVYYTVSYDELGGTEIPDATVVNGRTFAKPADPVREGYEFLGWYADSDYQTPYMFGTQIVTGNVTLYAQWALVKPGVAAYTVDFDLGYDAEANAIPAAKDTIGGKLYNAPTPKRDGYKFCGWWISDYEDGEKLTYKYTEDTVFTANTTLFAVWEKDDLGSKLSAPEVQVAGDSIVWNGVQGVSVYRLKVKGPDGFLAIDEDVSATSYVVDFAAAPAGDYSIELTAVASNQANNSDTVKRAYKNKAVGRVSQFTVLDGKVLLFNRVENAEVYYVSVDCGNEKHNHVMYNNGDSTYYSFANCDMQEGGIRFTVTAAADGYAPVESETFVYNRVLEKVEGVSVDEETQMVSWYPVENATNYIVSISCGDSMHSHQFVNVGSKTWFSLKECAGGTDGEIKINVYAQTKGYNSPAATEYSYTKTKLATPSDVVINNVDKKYILSWKDTGAEEYTVKIGNVTLTSTTNSIDVTEALTWVDAAKYEVTIKASTSTNESVWSDPVDLHFYTMSDKLSYKSGVVSWDAVLGATAYEIKVNNGGIETIDNGATSAAVEFTNAGTNIVYVRWIDTLNNKFGDWIIFEVDGANELFFDSRGGSEVPTQYKVFGDRLELPTPKREGYEFMGWYNTPKGPESNGAKYESGDEMENRELVLYAYWTPATFAVDYVVGSDGTLDATNGVATYTQHFKLDVPVVEDGTKVFLGWFAGSSSSSEQLTDDRGYSLKPWALKQGATVYAQYVKNVLEFTLLEDGTYSVSRGVNASKLTSITIPETYNEKPVTVVDGYAFQNCSKLVSVNIPDTIKLISEETAFENCRKLQEINIIPTEGNRTAVYSSVDGVLLYKNEITSQMELCYYPKARVGAYEIPEGVTEIPLRLFEDTLVTEVIVPTSVTIIRANSFFGCKELERVTFAEGGIEDLTIEGGAFKDCVKLTNVTFPARLSELVVNEETHTIDVFAGCSALTHVNVERGNKVYASNDGVITDKAGTTLIFCPTARTGSYTIPQGIEVVGDYAFYGCSRLTEIIVPGYVESVGNYAFAECNRVVRVEFSGGAVVGMKTEIGEAAFQNMKAMREIVFADGSMVSSLGAYAFAGAEGLRELTIPTTMEYIGDYAFEKAFSLATIEFANGEEGELEFGNYVFSECTNLTKVVLPASVKKLNLGVFDGCVNIAEIKVDASNAMYKDLDGVVFSKDGKELVFFPKGRKTANGEYDIPDGVESISEGAFKGMRYIETIVIDNTITNIGKYAFKDSMSLKTLTFASGNDTAKLVIDEEAFAGCGAITSVSLPARTQKIATKAFYKVAMSSVEFPAGLEEIGDYAFALTAITSVEIPADAVMGVGVFDTCTRLASVTFASGYEATAIPAGTFKGTAITTITIPKSIEKIGYEAFNDCEKLTSVVFEDGGTAPLIIGAADESEKEDGQTIAGVFMNAKALRSVNIPDRTVFIGYYAFAACSALETLEIKATSNLQRIDECAFYQCSSLASFYIPKTVQNTPYVDENTPQEYAIGSKAFAYSGLTEITFAEGGEGDLSFGEAAFASCGRVTGYKEGKEGPVPIQEYMTTINLPKRVAPIYVFVHDGTTQYAEWRDGVSMKTFSGGGALTPMQAVNVEEGGQHYGSKDGVLYKMAERGGEYVKDRLMMVPAYSAATITVPYTVSLIGSDQEGVSDNVVQKDSSNTARITTLAFEATPDGVEAVPLTIGRSAFSSVTTLTSVTFPERLVKICDSAFSYGRLATIHLPASLEVLGTSAFRDNTSAKSVTFAKGIKIEEIPDSAFYGCNNSSFTSLEIPASVQRIGNNAFYGCNKVTSLRFEENSQLTTVGNGAFVQMKFTSIVLPDMFTTISGNIFGNNSSTNINSSLQSITLPKTFTSFEVLDSQNQARFFLNNLTNVKEVNIHEENPYFMSEDGVVYTKDQKTGGRGTELIYYPRAKQTEDFTYTTPEGVETIGAFAFYQNQYLQHLVISADLVGVGYSAFSGCSYLSTITFADRESQLTLGDYAFQSCARLTGKTVTEDGVSKKVFEIPESVIFGGKSVFQSAFTNSAAANTIIRFVGENESTALNNTFYGATQIISVENIPCNLSDMNQTFRGCTKLASVTFHEDPNSMIATLTGTFMGCTALTSIDLPSVGAIMPGTINGMGSWTPGATGYLGAFQGCTKLASVTMKDCTTIGGVAFMNCTSLTKVELPDSVVSIGVGAFYGCTKLAEVKTSANLETIERQSFMNCSSLTSIEFYDFVSTIGKEAFSGCTKLANVDLGSSVETIQERAFYNAKALKNVVFPTVLRTIEKEAFYGCSTMTAIELPASVTSVGEYAFANCTNVETITVSNGLENLGDYAFMNCGKVQSFTIPSSLVDLGIGVFQGWTSLKELNVDGSNLDYAYKNGVLFNATYTKIIYVNASASGEFVVPETVTALAEGLFAGSAISSIVLPDTIREIPAKAFQGCKNLTSVTFPANLEKIGDMAFEGCTSLKSITIPKTVYSDFEMVYVSMGDGRESGYGVSKAQDGIGHYAFGNCTALENVIFEEGGTKRLSFGDFAFYGCTNLKGTLNASTGEYELIIPSRVRGDAVPKNAVLTSGGMGSGSIDEYTLEQGVGMYAFARCTSLTNVVFEDEGSMVMPERLLILIGAFQDCTALKSVKFGDTLGDKQIQLAGGKGGLMTVTKAAISENAFSGCKSLTTVIFPDDVSKISVASSAFDGLSVKLPSNLTIVNGSQGVDYGGGKMDWQDGGSNVLTINGKTTGYDPHNGIFFTDVYVRPVQ